jgi:hypothetical protein
MIELRQHAPNLAVLAFGEHDFEPSAAALRL